MPIPVSLSAAAALAAGMTMARLSAPAAASPVPPGLGANAPWSPPSATIVPSSLAAAVAIASGAPLAAPLEPLCVRGNLPWGPPPATIVPSSLAAAVAIASGAPLAAPTEVLSAGCWKGLGSGAPSLVLAPPALALAGVPSVWQLLSASLAAPGGGMGTGQGAGGFPAEDGYLLCRLGGAGPWGIDVVASSALDAATGSGLGGLEAAAAQGGTTVAYVCQATQLPPKGVHLVRNDYMQGIACHLRAPAVCVLERQTCTHSVECSYFGLSCLGDFRTGGLTAGSSAPPLLPVKVFSAPTSAGSMSPFARAAVASLAPLSSGPAAATHAAVPGAGSGLEALPLAATAAAALADAGAADPGGRMGLKHDPSPMLPPASNGMLVLSSSSAFSAAAPARMCCPNSSPDQPCPGAAHPPAHVPLSAGKTQGGPAGAGICFSGRARWRRSAARGAAAANPKSGDGAGAEHGPCLSRSPGGGVGGQNGVSVNPDPNKNPGADWLREDSCVVHRPAKLRRLLPAATQLLLLPAGSPKGLGESPQGMPV